MPRAVHDRHWQCTTATQFYYRRESYKSGEGYVRFRPTPSKPIDEVPDPLVFFSVVSLFACTKSGDKYQRCFFSSKKATLTPTLTGQGLRYFATPTATSTAALTALATQSSTFTGLFVYVFVCPPNGQIRGRTNAQFSYAPSQQLPTPVR